MMQPPNKYKKCNCGEQTWNCTPMLISFVLDQLGPRKMRISDICSGANHDTRDDSISTNNSDGENESFLTGTSLSSLTLGDADDETDPNFELSNTQQTRARASLARNAIEYVPRPRDVKSIDLKGAAIAGMRYKVSQTGTAAIASEVLQAVGLIDPTNTDLVITRCKIQREMENARGEITAKARRK